jgi:AcrR family transcriptional regulator
MAKLQDTRPRRPRNAAESERGGSERRAALVKIAAELFARNGFASTTVRQIADAAGVLSGSLYHHFDSKESIIDDLLSSCLDELLTQYRSIIADDGPPTEVFSRLVRAAFESFAKHRAAIMVMLNERNYLAQFPRFSYLPAAEAEAEQMWTKVIREGIRTGDFREDLDPHLTYLFARDVISVSARWYRPRGKFKPAQMADQYLGIILRGIERRPDHDGWGRSTGTRPSERLAK